MGLALAVLLLLVSSAHGQDLEARIADAQARAVEAAAEVAASKPPAERARSRLRAAESRAAPIRRRLHLAAVHTAALEQGLRDRHQAATGQVRRIEAERTTAAEEHDRRVGFDIGLAIAALILAAVALGWSWFRASAPVAALVRLPVGQAVGLCIGGGLAALIVGGAMREAAGLVGVIGGLLFGLGWTVPVALLLARHSAEVQRGRSRAWLGRERASAPVTRMAAVLFGVLCLTALLAGIFDGEAESRNLTAHLELQAQAASPSSPALTVSEERAAALRRSLAPLEAKVERRRTGLRSAQAKLLRAQTRLSGAEADERRLGERLERARAQERRERERAERREERQRTQEEREAQKAIEREERETEEEEPEATSCDPNYEGACLQDGIGDYDCAGGSGNGPNYVTGPIYVIGADPFGLDRDGDGVACEG